MSFARAFAALTGASAVSMVGQLLRGKLAALFLGPAGVGIFNQLSLAWNIVNVAGGLGSFNGIVQHGAEALARDDREGLRRLTSTFTLLLGAVSLVLALLGAVFSAPLSDWLLNDGGKHASLVALLMIAAPIGVSASLWRALLSAGQQVSALVRAQIASDIGGALVFGIMLIWLGLTGAVIGFLASHLILFLVQAWYVRRKLGPGLIRPRLRQFDWHVVRSNLGFGASGLLLIVLGNVGVLLVSQLLIGRLGPEANGYFANAWRIASVYLGAVTATTIGYFLPSLTRCADDAAMGREVNATLRFFLLVLPPVMAGIMALGDWVVWLILSSAFAPVAPLLLLMVPAELARIGTETILAQYLARRKLAPFTFAYLLQFTAFVGMAWLLVPLHGVAGAAMAYALAMSGSLLLALVLSLLSFGFRLEWATWQTALPGAFLLGAIVVSCLRLPLDIQRLIVCAAILVAWSIWILSTPGHRKILRGWLGLTQQSGAEN